MVNNLSIEKYNYNAVIEINPTPTNLLRTGQMYDKSRKIMFDLYHKKNTKYGSLSYCTSLQSWFLIRTDEYGDMYAYRISANRMSEEIVIIHNNPFNIDEEGDFILWQDDRNKDFCIDLAVIDSDITLNK